MHVLITGGAGFIGSHVAGELLRRGHRVTALDNLDPQVHPEHTWPAYVDDSVRAIIGDVRCKSDCRAAVADADAVIHLAAAVGVGQAQYQPAHYASVNCVGTAVLLEAIAERHRARPLAKLVMASSMAVYGERSHAEETSAVLPASIYGQTKLDQERLCMIAGEAIGLPTIALRLFNVYGANQSLRNPYTGAIPIWLSQVMGGRAPVLFGDGRQTRDFVHVSDVARAFAAAVESPVGELIPINVCTGTPRMLLHVAELLTELCGRKDLTPEITGRHRSGDVLHCTGYAGRAQSCLGFRAVVMLEDGLREVVEAARHSPRDDRSDEATRELESHGMLSKVHAEVR